MERSRVGGGEEENEGLREIEEESKAMRRDRLSVG